MCMLQIRYLQPRTALLVLFSYSPNRHPWVFPRISSRNNIKSLCYKLNRNSNVYSITRAPQDSSFDFDAIIDYGLSLAKGRKLCENDNGSHESNYVDRDSLARVFDVAALRVAAEECHVLQGRLKGHLLNWPRIRNIARVSGDDVDPKFEGLFREDGKQAEVLAGDVPCETGLAERVEIAEKFNSKGYVYFRKLAHISRPKKEEKKSEKRLGSENSSKNGVRRRNAEEYAVVEVVEDGNRDDDEDLSGLLGEDYRIKQWRGPTRLLLLDQRHANKSVSELPQAVQVVLKGDDDRSRKAKPELVQCKLTLFYDYWQMHEVLHELLPKGIIIPTAFETVGHVAHLNLRTEHLPYRRLIAQVIFDKNRPKIQTVVNKLDVIQNNYRTMQLEILAGNHSLVTSVVESGLRFHVDLATVYWNSRLSTERRRLIDSFRRGDNVCDVFSGVGPLSIAASKKVNRVYANDLNPSAVKYQMMNVAYNKVHGKIEVFNLDGREFIKGILGREKPVYITQVVMNLPKDAVEYLDAFRGSFRTEHRSMHLPMPTIHLYGFSKAPNPESDFLERIETSLGETPSSVDIHRVRLVAPRKWMLCATFPLPRNIAFIN